MHTYSFGNGTALYEYALLSFGLADILISFHFVSSAQRRGVRCDIIRDSFHPLPRFIPFLGHSPVAVHSSFPPSCFART